MLHEDVTDSHIIVWRERSLLVIFGYYTQNITEAELHCFYFSTNVGVNHTELTEAKFKNDICDSLVCEI